MTHCLTLTAVGLYQGMNLMFRFISHIVVPVGVVSVCVLVSVANAPISPNFPNPTGATIDGRAARNRLRERRDGEVERSHKYNQRLNSLYPRLHGVLSQTPPLRDWSP